MSSVKESDFELATSPPSQLAHHQTHAYDEFAREGRVDYDSKVVRLEAFEAKEHKLYVRQCSYRDGLRSNYALDWSGDLEIAGQRISLRALMAQDYGSKLPPLSERRLSNVSVLP